MTVEIQGMAGKRAVGTLSDRLGLHLGIVFADESRRVLLR